MAENRTNQNKANENHGTQKALIAAVSVVCTLLVILIAFLACKNTVYYSAAEKKAEENDFSAALEIAEKAGSKADLLCDYLALRVDINNNYPTFLSDLNMDKINEWNAAAANICENSGELSKKIASDVSAIKQKLDVIVGCVDRFDAMRSEVLSLMDIFSEINRLHTKDEQGKNTAFTVSEEKARLSQWQLQLNELTEYAETVPNSESIYLLIYLIKEAQGEITDITAAIDAVAESGYTETDLVRFSGTGQKTFPSIRNDSNESVNVLEKEKYVEFMFREIQRELAESLGEFYMP